MSFSLRGVTDAAASRVLPPSWPTQVPGDGLLCALVLAPSAMPRNRFFPLFASADARRARSRAAQLRATIRHLVGRNRFAIELTELGANGDGVVQMRYRLPEIKLERSIWFDQLELSLLRLAIDRIAPALVPDRRQADDRLGVLADPRFVATDEDRQRVDEALLQLWHALGGPQPLPLAGDAPDSELPGGG